MRRVVYALGLLGMYGCETAGRGFAAEDAAVDAGADVPRDAGPSGVGMRCSDEREQTEVLFGCRGGQVCLTSGAGFPMGYCTQDCRTRPCPADAFCVAEGSRRYCVQRCTAAGQCRVGDGYACTTLSPALPPGCVPEPEPTVTAGCPSVDADAGTAPDESLTRDREDTEAEVNPHLALNPRTGARLVSFSALDARGDVVGGLVADEGAGWRDGGRLVDREFNQVIDPAVAFVGADTRLAVWLGRTLDRPSPGIRVARSLGAMAFDEARAVEPAGRCAGGCTSPTVVAWGAASAAVSYLATSTRGEAWVMAQRSDDGGQRFGPATEVGRVVLRGNNHLVPAMPHLAASDDGHLALVWVSLRRENLRAPLGDTLNAVYAARSDDGGTTWTAPEMVSDLDESVVGHRPGVAVTADAVHALYVAGTPDARWTLRLRSRGADGAWRSRTVGAGPDGCATRGWPGLAAAADGTLWASWIDTAAGTGAAWVARCPAAPTRPCDAPVRVSQRGFPAQTGNDPTRWHGVHTDVAVDGRGRVHAVWSDTRAGGPALYAATVTPR